MRAIWSFWSRPHDLFYHRYWHSERAHLSSWALSVGEASRHYAETGLVADEAGATLLVDRLRLPFRRVDTRLETLNRDGADPQWWVLGKLLAYAAQSEPFVHLDADVVLWKPLPPRLGAAAVLAQNPEHFEFSDQTLYRADGFMRAMSELKGWLPEEWRLYAGRRRNSALCCGILGGADTAFLRRYARLGVEIIRHPRNAAVWERLGVRDNILVEQYFLAACLEASPPAGEARFLFPSSAHAFDPSEAEKAGYTHLIGDAKADPTIAARLEARLRADHPALYERCMDYCEASATFGPGRREAT
jgi:hypothetical protein